MQQFFRKYSSPPCSESAPFLTSICSYENLDLFSCPLHGGILLPPTLSSNAGICFLWNTSLPYRSSPVGMSLTTAIPYRGPVIDLILKCANHSQYPLKLLEPRIFSVLKDQDSSQSELLSLPISSYYLYPTKGKVFSTSRAQPYVERGYKTTRERKTTPANLCILRSRQNGHTAFTIFQGFSTFWICVPPAAG